MNRTLSTAASAPILIAAVILLAAACQTPAAAPPSEPPSAPPAEVAPTDTDQPSADSPSAPPQTDDSVAYSATLDALSGLESYEYSYSWNWEGGTAGSFQTGSFEGTGQVRNQPSRAEHVIWTTSDAEGAGSSIEYIFIEDTGTLWLREEAGGVWTPLVGMDPSIYQGFTLTGFLAPLMFSSADDLSYVGTESVNGVEARHYSSGNFSFLFGLGCTVTEASDDVWESTDYGVPVRHTSRFSGSCGGESAEWSFELNVTNINEPVDISPPA